MADKLVWGWLFPLRDPRTSKELTKVEEEYTFGGHKGFKILKVNNEVQLVDVGGITVNKKKVGAGNKTTLQHNDKIAIGEPDSPDYVYLNKSRCDIVNSSLPCEISERFLVSYVLGQGSFGEVSLVFEKNTSKRFAMKTLKKNPMHGPSQGPNNCTEINILNKVRHPCVIHTIMAVDNELAQFIVLEMMEGGNLSSWVYPKHNLTEANSKLIFYQLTLAIQYLHGQNIVHRDIKPENILLSTKGPETLIKVADFGVSKVLTQFTLMDTNIGTPVYMAPEYFNKTDKEYTKTVDIWSMGVVLYVCLSGALPFPGIQDVASCKYDFPKDKWSKISGPAISLIKDMLKLAPQQRVDISNILAHSWLKDNDMRKKANLLMQEDEPSVAVNATWGWLYPLNEQQKLQELSRSKFEMEALFRIQRTTGEAEFEALTTLYVNNVKCDAGGKVHLQHNARIAIAQREPGDFVYVNKRQWDHARTNLPVEITDKYLVTYQIAKGAFGDLFLVFNKKTCKKNVLKSVKKRPELQKVIDMETNILDMVQHPCIIHKELALETADTKYLMLELMEGGDLTKYITEKRHLNEQHVKLIFYQLVLAVEYLHQHDIVHRSINPDAILLATKQPETLIKLASFVMSKILNPGITMKTMVNLTPFVTPEFFRTDNPEYTKKVDIWAMGMVLYYCLSSELPFNEMKQLVIAKYDFPQSHWAGISEAAINLIKAMMKSEPEERITIEEILSHQWLQDDEMKSKANILMLRR